MSKQLVNMIIIETVSGKETYKTFPANQLVPRLDNTYWIPLKGHLYTLRPQTAWDGLTVMRVANVQDPKNDPYVTTFEVDKLEEKVVEIPGIVLRDGIPYIRDTNVTVGQILDESWDSKGDGSSYTYPEIITMAARNGGYITEEDIHNARLYAINKFS